MLSKMPWLIDFGVLTYVPAPMWPGFDEKRQLQTLRIEYSEPNSEDITAMVSRINQLSLHELRISVSHVDADELDLRALTTIKVSLYGSNSREFSYFRRRHSHLNAVEIEEV